MTTATQASKTGCAEAAAAPPPDFLREDFLELMPAVAEGAEEATKAVVSPLFPLSAAEAAEMILRVDDIIRCAPRRRDDQGHDH